MSTLSREARAIVAAGKSELMAKNDDRSRIAGLLRIRIGAAGLTFTAPVKAAPLWFAGKLLRTLTVAGTLGVVGVLASVVYHGRKDVPAPAQAKRAVTIQSTPVREQPLAEPPEAARTPDPPVPAPSAGAGKVESPSRSAKASRDSLGEEVQILSRAEKELHNGRPALALLALDEHQRRFASGALVQERAAARIQALCALGRTEEASAELTKLKRNSPNSPQAAHAASPCEALR